MSILGSKTAVSCLQEYLVSKKMLPQYHLIHKDESQGPHKPEFTIRVQAGDLTEDGTGRSMQEAKHRAAEKMLKVLKVISDDVVEEEVNDLDQEIAENYVGQLKELCYNQHYPEPKYSVEEEAGPPHSKIFKMVCSVSQLQEYGIDKTKKRAKQRAAAKMIQCLKEVGGKKVEEALANPESPMKVLFKSTPQGSGNEKEVIEKYHTLKGTNAPVSTKDNAAFYKDHYKAYIGLQETSPTLAKIMTNSDVITLENSVSLIMKIANELGAKVETEKIPSKKEDTITVMTMSITPPLGDAGCDEKNAAFNLLHTFVCLCRD